MYSTQILQVLMILHEEIAERYPSYCERNRRETVRAILLKYYNVDLTDIEYYYLLDKTEQQQEIPAYSNNYFVEIESHLVDYISPKTSWLSAGSNGNSISTYPYNYLIMQGEIETWEKKQDAEIQNILSI
ncbi:hypothetical protein GWI33_006408 [Rhynchophorus ferrugineus]|uniref:Uncharacterized protein n=1 Tax=Rhynchophorus ferrugineus TaxID=354439 RepID=A0A834MD25_RHYFE|nr:hypothetical protein GWI33_006408 [Rhynchophorus ferrugineus]